MILNYIETSKAAGYFAMILNYVETLEVAELFYASRRIVHNFGLEYFQFNSSLVVAAYMSRNYGLGNHPQLQLNMVLNYPQFSIS